MQNFWRYRFLAVLCMAAIFGLSAIPERKLAVIYFPGAHLTAHILEYTTLGFFLARSFLNSLGKSNWLFAGMTALTISALFGATDEWHQTFVAGRKGELSMVGLDILFAACGISFYLYRTRGPAHAPAGS